MQAGTLDVDLGVTHSFSPPQRSSLRKYDALPLLGMAAWIMSKPPLLIKSFWEFTEVSDSSGNPPCDSAENSDGEPLAGS